MDILLRFESCTDEMGQEEIGFGSECVGDEERVARGSGGSLNRRGCGSGCG